MDKYNVYQDMSRRTGGEIYLGIVGPVRTGKSTFIKRFMELRTNGLTVFGFYYAEYADTLRLADIQAAAAFDALVHVADNAAG